MADQLDFDNRDPNDLNSHVKVAFDEVIGEPDGAHSHPCAWKCAYNCFNGGKNCCYMFLTFLCAWWLGLCWGCEFACITFVHVWEVTPCLRVFMINCGCLQKFFGTCVACCMAPICETCGLVFSKVAVQNL